MTTSLFLVGSQRVKSSSVEKSVSLAVRLLVLMYPSVASVSLRVSCSATLIVEEPSRRSLMLEPSSSSQQMPRGEKGWKAFHQGVVTTGRSSSSFRV